MLLSSKSFQEIPCFLRVLPRANLPKCSEGINCRKERKKEIKKHHLELWMFAAKREEKIKLMRDRGKVIQLNNKFSSAGSLPGKTSPQWTMLGRKTLMETE